MMESSSLSNSSPSPIEGTEFRAIRILPGIIIVILQWLLRLGLPAVSAAPVAEMIGYLGGLLGGVALVIWWTFFSRAPLFERWAGVLLLLAMPAITSRVVDISIATGQIGMMFFFYAVPCYTLAFVAWAVSATRLPALPRRVALIALFMLCSGAWLLVRSDGLDGNGNALLNWRWAKVPEQALLSQADVNTAFDATAAATLQTGAGWPGFRGSARDGFVHGVKIATDWKATPPVLLWRRPIGPACSSCAIRGDRLYTQEQRGPDEVVSCYQVATGRLVWMHRDTARFWDSHAGAGPRATPTISGDTVYTFGATGILNVLNADTGRVRWSRNAAADTHTAGLPWGFCSSPLVVGNKVIVAVVGTLAAYDIADGTLHWRGPVGGNSYSSPHLLTIHGVPQVLLMSGGTVISVAPDTGAVLWKYTYPKGDSIVQPAMSTDGDIFISFGDPTVSLRRLSLAHTGSTWTMTERWSSSKMAPNFNDFVVHRGYAYGYFGDSLVCLDINNGTRKWRGVRMGGQLLLLADQDVLLILTEKGELVLVKADPVAYTELSRVPAITGRTWNHPALAGNVLVVRNGQEMASFRLPKALTDRQ